MKRHVEVIQRVRPLGAAPPPVHISEEVAELARRIHEAATAYVSEHHPPVNQRFTIHFETPIRINTLVLVQALDAECGSSCNDATRRNVDFVESNGQQHTFIALRIAS